MSLARVFFTFGPIYKPRAWPVLFTSVSIDLPQLSPVVLRRYDDFS